MKALKCINMLCVIFIMILFVSSAFAQTMEYDTDRPGMDYKKIDLQSPDPKLCEDLCKKDSTCKAFTYVKPAMQQVRNARCYLKSGVPSPVKNSCCISGVIPVQPSIMEFKGTVRQPQVIPQFETMTNQKLQQLKTAEESKRMSRVQGLHGEFALKEKKDQLYSCAGPTILYVYPTTVHPGDPVLIHGCGFAQDKGMVIMSDFNMQLKIDSWTDKDIKATIPSVKGFADPKNITLKISTVTGGVSAPSAGIVLKPNMEFKKFSGTMSIKLGASSASKCESGLGMYHYHISKGDLCKGTDMLTLPNVQLKNNWSFYSLDLYCQDYFVLSFPSKCSSGLPFAVYVDPGINLANIVGQKSFPFQQIPVNWKCDPSTGGYYYLEIVVLGPEGTSF